MVLEARACVRRVRGLLSWQGKLFCIMGRWQWVPTLGCVGVMNKRQAFFFGFLCQVALGWVFFQLPIASGLYAQANQPPTQGLSLYDSLGVYKKLMLAYKDFLLNTSPQNSQEGLGMPRPPSAEVIENNQATLRYVLALQEAQRANYLQAQSYLDEAINQASSAEERIHYYWKKAFFAAKQEDLWTQIAAYEALLAEPSSAKDSRYRLAAYDSMASVYLRLGNPLRAITCYDSMERIAGYSLGLAKRRLRAFKAAQAVEQQLNESRRLLGYLPEDESLQLSHARILALHSSNGAAIRYLDSLLLRDSTRYALSFLLGSLYLQEGRLPKAQLHWKALFSLPFLPEEWLISYFSSTPLAPPAAWPFLDTLIQSQRNKASVELRRVWGHFYVNIQAPERARAVFASLLASSAATLSDALWAIRLATNQGRYAEAATWLKEMSALHARHPALLCEQGHWFLAQDSLQQATACFQEGLKNCQLPSLRPPLYMGLASVRARKRAWTEANDAYQKAYADISWIQAAEQGRLYERYLGSVLARLGGQAPNPNSGYQQSTMQPTMQLTILRKQLEALVEETKDVVSLRALATVYAAEGKAQLARQAFEEVILRSYQPTASLFVAYAEVLLMLGETKDAIKNWKKAIHLPRAPKGLKEKIEKHTLAQNPSPGR